MHALKIFSRITRVMGKVILGMLLVFIALITIIHLPPAQGQLACLVSDYLSARIKAKVDMQQVQFSILGNLEIQKFEVWDPAKDKIFAAQKIEVSTNIFKLLSGDYDFDRIYIAGVDGKLIERENGLNIQYIIDSFQSENTDDEESDGIVLKFKIIQLENINFLFSSTQNGSSVANNVGKLVIQSVEYSSHANKIQAEKIYLQHAEINILSKQGEKFIYDPVALNDTSTNIGSGILVDIKNVEVLDSDFSFHKDRILNTPKFDPDHIELEDIQFNLLDILIGTDSTAGALESLSAQMSGIKLADGHADVYWDRNRLAVSDLHLIFDENHLEANFTGWYELNSPKDVDHTHAELVASGKMNPVNISYFFKDSVMNYFRHWGLTEFGVEGDYHGGRGSIKSLKLNTGNSHLQAYGIINDVLSPQKISWENFSLRALVGADFQKSIKSSPGEINLPPDASLQLRSSGSLEKLYVDGEVYTRWGDVKMDGFTVRKARNDSINMNFTGENVALGEWIKKPWLGSMNLSMKVIGVIGDGQSIEVNGVVGDIKILDQSVHNIAFKSRAGKNDATITLTMDDPMYAAEISSEISFAGPLIVTSYFEFDNFRLDGLFQMDSMLSISGGLKSKLSIEKSNLEASVAGEHLLLQSRSSKYLLDTMVFHGSVSPTISNFEYFTDYGAGSLTSNFDVTEIFKTLWTRPKDIFKSLDNAKRPAFDRVANFNFELKNANLFSLLNVDVDAFSALKVAGDFDEQKQTVRLHTLSGKFNGYGISLDTLNANLLVLRDSVAAEMFASNLFFKSFQLGNLDFNYVSMGDTAISNFLLSRDSVTLLGLQTHIVPTDLGTHIYPDKLRAYNNDYLVDPKSPVYVEGKNVILNHFQISRDIMRIHLNGDFNDFDASFENIDLTALNHVFTTDSLIVSKGYLNGSISYSLDSLFSIDANVDSLSLYHSDPFTLSATTGKDGNTVPFNFRVTNASNAIDLKGNYYSDIEEVDGVLHLDVNNLELFDFLVSDVIAEMNGTIKGEVALSGAIRTPAFKGSLEFLDLGLTTVNPRLSFYVQHDTLVLDQSSLLFNNFTLYDQGHNPLTVNGNLYTRNYESFGYNLQIKANQYDVLNNIDSTNRRVSGSLVVDSDIKLTGEGKDTNVESRISIKDATNLTVSVSNDDIELLKADGIVEFVDPALLGDSFAHDHSVNFYDSLIASLPAFNLTSSITIEDNAVIRLLIDTQSGDYLEASGGATLELDYDRSGNLHLAGDYTIKKGFYRLSFYDLVKKNFELVPGSTVNWSGTPESGDLDIKAVHTVESNSIGLIGHEVNENEKSIYKRSLDYKVGINIGGTFDKPIVSFSLDLPEQEKANFPVLANKLERLKQPEFESELNKQVFGLLVLGGFLPETSSSDINSSLIATTALSNSVNSLLASQLNRFASQYIKGVNIDVGIQSYSDYSAPGGKTQTAMDFRISKSIMDDRLSFEIGGDFDINQDQSGANSGSKNYRSDIAIIYNLTGNDDKQLKLFNNETYDIVYQEVRNTGISLIFVREFASKKTRRKSKR